MAIRFVYEPWSLKHIHVVICVHVHGCAVIVEAQCGESAINWATRISHAELMRLICVKQRCQEDNVDQTQALTVEVILFVFSTHVLIQTQGQMIHDTVTESRRCWREIFLIYGQNPP